MATPQPSAPSTSFEALRNAPLDTSFEKWTGKALQSYLRVRGLTFSGMKKSELIIPPRLDMTQWWKVVHYDVKIDNVDYLDWKRFRIT